MKNYTLTAEPGTYEVKLVREFDAPAAKVFQACVDAKAIPQWWGPSQYTTVVDRLEPKAGGAWRFKQTGVDGEEFAFRGFFHQVEPGKRLVYTFEWEGLPGHILLETIDFEDLPGGRSRMIDSSVFQTVEDRDGMVAYGMEDGAAESTDRLSALLKTL